LAAFGGQSLFDQALDEVHHVDAMETPHAEESRLRR
jgi:hypothetical protein